MRHAIRAFLLTVCVLSGGSCTAFGQTGNHATACGTADQPSDSGTGRGEWTVAAYLGGAQTARSSLTISQPSLGNLLRFDDVYFEGRSLEGPLYYGFRGGYFLPRISILGIEAEFIHMKVYADTTRQVQASGLRLGAPIDRILTLRDIIEHYSTSHGVNLLLFNVVGRYSTGARNGGDRLLLFGRFGAGPSIPHTESTVDGDHQEQYEAGRLGWQLAGGVELHVWRGLHALFEYKFTRTNQRGKVYLGHANSLLRSQHGIFGFAYHFGRRGNRKP